MPVPGDVVLCNFLGAQGWKRRPGVIISTYAYHANSLDVIVSGVTTRLAKARGPTNCLLQDWAAAGLHQPSVFRVYITMTLQSDVVPIGRLSDRDWQAVQARLRAGLAVT